MYHFSNVGQFLDDLQYTHQIVTKAQILYKGDPVGDPVPVMSGTVTCDLTATYLRSCDVIIAPLPQRAAPRAEYVPDPYGGGSSVLTPWGHEIKLYRSIKTASGHTYPDIPLGIFRPYDVNVVDTGAGIGLEVQGYDRSFTVDIQQFTDVYTIPKGTNRNQAILDIVKPRILFQLQHNFPPASGVTGLLTYGIDSGTSPWQAAWMIARANGNQLFFDVNGVLKQAKWPDPTQQDIAWNLLNSSAKSILFEVQRTLTTQPILGNASILPNHVIAYYETASGATPAAANEGVITTSTSSTTVTGQGTTFTSLSKGYVLYSANANGPTTTVIGTIASIQSDTKLTLTGNANVALNNQLFAVSTPNPARADAKITDPSSPLRVGGQYGDVPLIVTTNKTSDLQRYADQVLASYIGQDEQLTINCIENPTLECNDVIYLNRNKSGVRGRYFVTAITHSLEPETPMQITCYRVGSATGGPPAVTGEG